MALIDFSNCTRLNTKLYGGSNGSKIGILYNNQKYLLKFSSVFTIKILFRLKLT